MSAIASSNLGGHRAVLLQVCVVVGSVPHLLGSLAVVPSIIVHTCVSDGVDAARPQAVGHVLVIDVALTVVEVALALVACR